MVQATGWGKSLVYFLATHVFRSRGLGPTLLISPLLSLMRDQIRAAERLGLCARRYTSDNSPERSAIEQELRLDRVDVLLIAPERLSDGGFRDLIVNTSLSKTSLIVVDEAHCISEWGHDFRPDYRRISELIRVLPATAILATTATANDRVTSDVQKQIGRGTRVIRGSLARESLRLQIISGFSRAGRLAWMSDHLPGLPGSGIIYALRQRDTELVSNWLRDRGISVAAYHAGMENSERERLESRLLQNDVKALVATVALGMGFDKPDLGFVIHYQSPSNLVAYYQQIGRAGRAIQDAVAVMFLGTEDDRIHEWFIDNARPPREEIETVLSALASGAMSERELEQKVNLRPARLKRVLATLSTETEAPIVRIGARFQLAPYPYQPNQGTLERLAAKRRRERSELVNLAETQSCLMVEVRRALGEGDPAPCGKCSNCTGSTVVPVVAQHRSIELAEEHLKSRVFPIEPRKRWPPKGALAEYGFAGNIDPSLRCSPGTCLSLWGDPGIAEWVQYDKREGQFREELLVAAAAAIRRAGWSPRPTWVCAVPSLRTGALVPQFAQSLADRLCLPYVPAVRKARETDQQKQQQNSFHQAANLDGAFRVDGVEPGPVILIDDTVDSRWTFTIISALLQAAGSGCVYPLALCSTASGDPDE